MYVAIVVAAVMAHLAFIGYLVAGGVIAWRWPATIWVHWIVVAWAIAITVGVVDCPLTTLERWARAQAGMAPLPGDGFIAYYLTGVLYPAGWSGAVRVLVFVVVALSWLVWWRRVRVVAGRH